MSDRLSDRQDFLRGAGWEGADIAPLPGDASTRHYARLHLGGQSAMLMDQPQGVETAVAPPDASEAARRRTFARRACARRCARLRSSSDALIRRAG